MGGQPHHVRRPLPKGRGSCLAPSGVYLAACVTAHAGALLPHPFTLTCVAPGDAVRSVGGLLSVALSRGLLRVAVSNHRALWSPDFPRPAPSSCGMVRGAAITQPTHSQGVTVPLGGQFTEVLLGQAEPGPWGWNTAQTYALERMLLTRVFNRAVFRKAPSSIPGPQGLL